ncbi:MAG: type II toxin-antitoxin system HigA family antitoxin [Marinifilaceae bacterium]
MKNTEEMKTWKVIKTEEEYDKAIARVEQLMELAPPASTPEGDELELLAVLIANYEKTNYEIPELDPIEVIEYFLEERGYQRKDLVNVIGDKTQVSRILNRKRKLTLDMIRKLESFLSIPIELLTRDYELAE